MAKEVEHFAKITFGGAFPIDMLRYDVCTPALEKYSGVIDESIRNHYLGGGEVVVTRRAPRSWKWTVKRWKSFGCEVKPVDSAYNCECD